LVAGSLLLISLFSNYGHVDLPWGEAFPLDQQVGIPQARRARVEARCTAAQCRFLLAPSPGSRRQLSEALVLMLEQSGTAGL